MSDSFFNKVAGWRSTTLLEKSLRRMNFSKLLRAPILLNIANDCSWIFALRETLS